MEEVLLKELNKLQDVILWGICYKK
jgi:hypothetical protein